MADEQIVSEVLSLYHEAERNVIQRRDLWHSYYKLYRGYIDEPSYPWQSTVFVPQTYSTVETIVPRILDAIFAEQRPVGVEPFGAEDVLNAEIIEELLNYQIKRIGLRPFVSTIKDCVMYGTGIIKVGWRVDEKVITAKKDDVNQYILTGSPTKTEKDVVKVYDGPELIPVDLFEFFPDPEAVDIEDARYIIERFYKPRKYLKELEKQGIYKNIDDIPQQGANLKERDERQANINFHNPINNNEMEDNDVIELLELWTDERVITLANKHTIIRNEINPYWDGVKPYVKMVLVPVQNEFYGIGAIEPMQYLQHELNDKRNQRLDNVNMSMNRMWMWNTSYHLPNGTASLISRPHGIIPVEGMVGDDVRRALRPLDIPDVTQSSYVEEDIIKRDIQIATGVNDYFAGNSAPDSRLNKTATGISLTLAQAQARFKYSIDLISESFKKIIEKIFARDKQFLPDDYVIRLFGEAGYVFKEIGIDNLYGSFDFTINIGNALIPKQIEQDQLLQLVQMLAPQGYDIEPLLMRFAQNYGVKDIASVKKLPPTPQEQAETELTQAQAQAALTGEMTPDQYTQEQVAGAVSGTQPRTTESQVQGMM